VFGQLVTLTATVAAAEPGQPAPTGGVVFKDGSTLLGSGTLDTAGHASLSILLVSTGYHAITAVYQGDPNFTSSTSPVVNQLVNQDVPTMLFSWSAEIALAGQPVTYTATVSANPPGAAVPGGTVVFRDGATPLGTATLVGGTGTFTTSLTPGTHLINAVYLGSSGFTAATPTGFTQIVNDPVPIIANLSPASLPEGSPAFTLTINGSNFVPGLPVTWNGTPLTLIAQSGTQIQATVPASLLAEDGTAHIVVTNPGPGGGPSEVQTFAITDAPLTAFGRNISVTGNKNFSGVVATFSDGNPDTSTGEYTAIITWDDGSAQFGTISGTGTFRVAGSHTFTGFKNVHVVTITIFDKDGSTGTVTDNIIDPPGRHAIPRHPLHRHGPISWQSPRSNIALDVRGAAIHPTSGSPAAHATRRPSR
jgi:hypothetical protein